MNTNGNGVYIPPDLYGRLETNLMAQLSAHEALHERGHLSKESVDAIRELLKDLQACKGGAGR